MATACLFLVLFMSAQVAGGEQHDVDKYSVDKNGDATIDRCFVRVQDEVRGGHAHDDVSQRGLANIQGRRPRNDRRPTAKDGTPRCRV